MRLCPICDTKIEGSWCRRCGRFVTPIAYEGKMHLNESHDMKKDADCEFHNPSNTRKETVKHKTAIQPGASAAAKRPVWTGNSNQTGKKQQVKSGNSGARIVRIIITAYILMFLFNILTPLLSDAIEWKDIFDKLKSVGSTEAGSISPVSQKLGAEFVPPDIWGGEAMLQQGIMLERVESSSDDSTIVYVYEEEDIRKLDFHCDNCHFPFTVEELIEVMGAEYPELAATMTWSDNYVYENITGDKAPKVYFNEFYDVTMDSNDWLYIDIEADTATKQVHMLLIRADTDNEAARKAAYDFIRVILPEGYSSCREFEQACSYARVWGDYLHVKSTDEVEIIVRLRDGFDVRVCPRTIN